MRYFIESVNTLTTTGKSRKGALLQSIVKRFEHTVLKGDDALTYFIGFLQGLVDTSNASYRGKTVTLHTNPGHIYAKNDNNGHEAHIFSISYAPIGDEFCFYDVPSAILGSVENLCGHKFATEMEAVAKNHCKQKGGNK